MNNNKHPDIPDSVFYAVETLFRDRHEHFDDMDIIILLMWAAIDEECSIRDAANYILFTGAVDSWPSSNPTDQELVLSILQEGHVFENLPHVIGNFEEFSRQPILEDDDRSPHWEAVLLAAARYPILLQEHFEYEIVEGSSASLLG